MHFFFPYLPACTETHFCSVSEPRMSRLCVPFFLGMRQPYVRTVFRVRDPLSLAKSTLKKLYDFLREPSRNPGPGWPEPGAAEGPTNNERLPLAFPFRLPEHREAVAPLPHPLSQGLGGISATYPPICTLPACAVSCAVNQCIFH
jgi:hypothetical protein